jgi:hypothetical protein
MLGRVVEFSGDIGWDKIDFTRALSSVNSFYF